MVRAKANKINGSDDALVKKLQREIQHLRDILNIRRKGGQGELAEQLLALKEENNKLREKNLELRDVEKLKHENKVIKLELQKLMSSNTHQNFHNDNNRSITNGDQESNLFLTDYNVNSKWDKNVEQDESKQEEQLFTKKAFSPSETSNMPNKENFYSEKELLNSITSFQNTNGNNFTPRISENPKNDMFPSLYAKPNLTKLLEKHVSPPSTTKNSSNLSNFQINSLGLKGKLEGNF